MGHKLLLPCLSAAWNCSFIQCYGKQVAGTEATSIASYQEANRVRAYTKSGCLLLCFNSYTTRIERNPGSTVVNQQNYRVVYLHFGELA